MHVEHIIPNAGNEPENLCLSCSSCNLSKATFTAGVDAETGVEAPLFNPRIQNWSEHFEWIDSGLRLRGKTAVGRVTVTRLKMNHQRLIRARRNWIIAGNHPPEI